jgi:hypothetical protein
MKKILIALIVIMICAATKANRSLADSIPADPKDVSSPEAIVAAVYDVISGPAGQKRNWDRMRTLFVPDARMIATGKRQNGEISRRVMSVEDYISNSGPFLEKEGFFEKEIGKTTEQFGNIVHVFSTYESKKTLADEKHSCGASTVFNYGMMANAGGSLLFFGKVKMQIHQYRKNILGRKD